MTVASDSRQADATVYAKGSEDLLGDSRPSARMVLGGKEPLFGYGKSRATRAERKSHLARLLTVALGEPEDVESAEAAHLAEQLMPLIWQSDVPLCLSPESQKTLERLFQAYGIDPPSD